MTPREILATGPRANQPRPARAAVAATLLGAVAYFAGPVGAPSPAGAQPLAVRSRGADVPVSSSTLAPSAVEVTGFGFGHGRGMGQWGAYGYASVYGWDYEQILSHYYGGTRLGKLASPEPDITVHLTGFDGNTAAAEALAGGSLGATWPGGGHASAAAIEVTSSGGEQVVLSGPGCDGPWRVVARTVSPVTISAAGASGAGASGSELRACLPGIGPRIYQGYLVATPGGQLDNVVPLEDYVDGVVAAESPPSWADSGGEAALEALAVAARSVALALVAASGSICDTTQCQVYKGLPDQYGLTADAAVSATAGEVLYCETGTSCGPAGSVAVAEYSSSTGGYTAGGLFPAVPDLGDSVAANPVHTWVVRIPLVQLESTFPTVGTVEQIDVTQRNGLGQLGGRVEELRVVGSAGSVGLTGDQFAADFDLYSDWFEVKGPAPAPATTSTTGGTTTTGTSTTSTTSTASTAPATTTSTLGKTTSTAGKGSGPAPDNDGATGANHPSSPNGGAHLGLANGYWVANSDGDVAAFGEATSYGTAAGTSLQGIVTGMATMPDDKGYWLVGANGGVLAFGDASWYGSASKLDLAKRVIGMAPTPNGRGYWLVASDGGVFAYGNARFYGSTGKFHLDEPIVGIAATPDGHGYWLVSSNGGIFAFGDAHFYGSAGHVRLQQRIVGMVPSPDGRGYFLVAKDGGVFAYGDARFLGSLPGKRIATSVSAVTATNDGRGYYVVGTNGRVYAFGQATPARELVGAGLSLAGAVAIVGYR